MQDHLDQKPSSPSPVESAETQEKEKFLEIMERFYQLTREPREPESTWDEELLLAGKVLWSEHDSLRIVGVRLYNALNEVCTGPDVSDPEQIFETAAERKEKVKSDPNWYGTA